VAVREFYKFAAAEQFVDGSVLAALYQVADSRHLPAHLSVEGAVWATSPGRGTGSNLLAGRARTTWFGRSPGLPTLDPFHGVEDPSRNTRHVRPTETKMPRPRRRMVTVIRDPGTTSRVPALGGPGSELSPNSTAEL